MSVGVGLIPMVIVPLTFLFVLLIILIAKAPKAGAWVVGGLLLLTPMFLWRFAATGALAHAEAIPLFVVPVTFLFVLLVILLAKAPKIGVGMIVALVVMVVLGLLLVPAFFLSHREVAQENPIPPANQWRESAEERAASIRESQRVFGEYMHTSSGAAAVLGSSSTPPMSPSPLSPIWSEGVEQEFEADVYPSSSAAARALGRRMAGPIRTVTGDPNAAIKVVLFQEGNERSLVAAFGHAMEKELPGVRYSIEADLRNIDPGEVGLTLRVGEAHQMIASAGGATAVISGPRENTRIVVTAFTTEQKRASAEAHFVDKPWVDSFGAFASERPDRPFVVARSNGTCTSEGEANQQALDDARARLTEALGNYAGRRFAELGQSPISTTDVLNGGFVVDRFVQSFGTSASKVWRQALLIDVSGPTLSQLSRVKIHQSRQVRESWARMGFSAIGVLVLISAIYFFLNMATRGYYEWSLRIAGVILAIVAIVSILMIVQ